jgi:hypothetical protein
MHGIQDYTYNQFCLLYLISRQRKQFSSKRAAYIRVLQLSMERSAYDGKTINTDSYTVV